MDLTRGWVQDRTETGGGIPLRSLDVVQKRSTSSARKREGNTMTSAFFGDWRFSLVSYRFDFRETGAETRREPFGSARYLP